MASSGSAVGSHLEDDLAISDSDDSAGVNHWPELPRPAPPHHPSLVPHHGAHQSPSTTCGKRSAEDTPDSAAGVCQFPAAKSAKNTPPDCGKPPACPPLPANSAPPVASSRLPSALPAFAPRDSYVKLAFTGTPSSEVKLRWLSEVTTAFHLQRDAAEVKMSALTSRFVYVSRLRTDILERIQSGEFLSLPLVPQDSQERPRKYPQYILTRYPVDVDHRLAEQYKGVYSARRFIQNGSPINRIVIVWSLPDPPPDTITFDFLPVLPPCEVRRLNDDRPWCFRCWGIGHISRYCSASPKCAWCAGAHESRECVLRRQPQHTSATTSTTAPPPPPDPSRWKCPRCLQTGVNVWHGCARRQPQPSGPASTPPPPPSMPVPSVPSSSQPDAALRKLVASLQVRCTALEERFASIDARIDSLVTAHTATAARLSNLAETQEVLASTVSVLAEKVDAVVDRLEKLFEVLPTSGQSSQSRASSSTRRSPPSKRHVR